MAVSTAISEVSFPCRLLGHKWEIYLPENRLRYALHLRCARCNMRRHDECDSHGNLQTRRYLDVPKGYYVPKGEVRPVVEDLRVWAMRRQSRLMGRAQQQEEATA